MRSVFLDKSTIRDINDCNLSPWYRVIYKKLIATYHVKKFSTFMGPNISLSSLQNPVTEFYTELDLYQPFKY
jgi:hypothetical protein